MQALKTNIVRLAVLGSRDFCIRNRVYQELDELRKICPNLKVIISGGAKGPDSFGVEWAKDRGLIYRLHLAQWDDMSAPCVRKINNFGKEYNALAGFKRNRLIIMDCDAVIAFWDGKSPGTKDSITKAKNLGKPVIIVSV